MIFAKYQIKTDHLATAMWLDTMLKRGGISPGLLDNDVVEFILDKDNLWRLDQAITHIKMCMGTVDVAMAVLYDALELDPIRVDLVTAKKVTDDLSVAKSRKEFVESWEARRTTTATEVCNRCGNEAGDGKYGTCDGYCDCPS